MNKHIKYLKYLARHKFFVMQECFRVGLWWRGIAHDISKFTPTEWFPYVETFYGDKPSPRDHSGAYDPLKIGGDFDYAWLSHQHNNPHHWQYWMLRGDDGWTKTLPMPHKYRLEMLCDWRGAGGFAAVPEPRGRRFRSAGPPCRRYSELPVTRL